MKTLPDSITQEQYFSTKNAWAPAEIITEKEETINVIAALSPISEKINSPSKVTPWICFLIVHVYPFWDAAISLLPFVFLTIAIADEFNM